MKTETEQGIALEEDMEGKLRGDARLKSFSKMRELMTNYYLSAKDAGNRGQKVAWVTSGAPVEFLHAMDVVPIYPENHAAMCGASKMAVELQQASEEKGYSMDLCSYARTDIGSIFTGNSPVLRLPKPDFMVACNNICTTVVKWYEVVSRFYQVPVFMMDMPFLHKGLEGHIVDYVAEQMKEYVRSNFEDRVRLLKGMVEKYGANGFMMHSDRSCKPYSLGQYVIRDEVTRRTGVPGLVIEADMNDSRQWAEAPTMTRIQAYLETLSQRTYREIGRYVS